MTDGNASSSHLVQSKSLANQHSQYTIETQALCLVKISYRKENYSEAGAQYCIETTDTKRQICARDVYEVEMKGV